MQRNNTERISQAFLNFYTETVNSHSYLQFCKEIQGSPVHSYNMLSKTQWKHFFEHLTTIDKDSQVLDLAMGSGHILQFIENEYHLKGFGVDILQSSIIPEMKTRYRQLDLNTSFVIQDQYDFIYCLDGFYNIPKKEKKIEQLVNNLNKNGSLYLTFSETKEARLVERKLPAFEKYDFSVQDQLMWELSSEYIEQHKDNLPSLIYQTKRLEIDKFLKLHKGKKINRYSYIFYK
tara:strand:- start:133722 stop:134420 length:699 start_codon:yes stop_codon:yes gene_type:complete